MSSTVILRTLIQLQQHIAIVLVRAKHNCSWIDMGSNTKHIYQQTYHTSNNLTQNALNICLWDKHLLW